MTTSAAISRKRGEPARRRGALARRRRLDADPVARRMLAGVRSGAGLGGLAWPRGRRVRLAADAVRLSADRVRIGVRGVPCDGAALRAVRRTRRRSRRLSVPCSVRPVALGCSVRGDVPCVRVPIGRQGVTVRAASVVAASVVAALAVTALTSRNCWSGSVSTITRDVRVDRTRGGDLPGDRFGRDADEVARVAAFHPHRAGGLGEADR